MRRQWKAGNRWRWNLERRRNARRHERFVLWMDGLIEENNKRYGFRREPDLKLIVNNVVEA